MACPGCDGRVDPVTVVLLSPPAVSTMWMFRASVARDACCVRAGGTGGRDRRRGGRQPYGLMIGRESFNPSCGILAFRAGSARAPPGLEDDQCRGPVPPGRREDRAA